MRRYTELCWDGSPGDEGKLGVQGFLTTAGTSCCEEGDVEGLYSRSCVLEAVVHAQVPALSSKAVFPRLLGEAKDLSSSKDTQLGCRYMPCPKPCLPPWGQPISQTLEVQRPTPLPQFRTSLKGFLSLRAPQRSAEAAATSASGSTPPSARYCFLHSLNRCYSQELSLGAFLQGNLYFRVSFMGNLFLGHQSLTEVVSGSKI